MELTTTYAVQMLSDDQLDSRSEQHHRNLVARRLISKYMEVGKYEKAIKPSEFVIKENIDV